MASELELYRLLFDASPRPMWAFDRGSLRIVLANEAAAQLYGWSREELLGMTLLDLRPAGEHDAFQASYAVSKEQPTYRRRGRHWNKRGELMEVHLELKRMPLPDREWTLAVITDITGIAEAERRFRLLVEHSSDAIALVNEDHVIEYVSPGNERILGRTPEQSKGAHALPRLHPDDRETWVPPRPGETKTNIARVQHADGTWRWLESTTTNLLHDPAVRAYVSNFRDITARKQAEDALRHSEANMRALIERSPVAILVHRHGRFVYVNPAAVALCGYDRADEIVGRDVLDLPPAEEHEIVTQRIEQLAASGEVPPIAGRMLRRDGRIIHVEGESIQLDFDGQRSHVTIVRDVTERDAMVARMAMADRMVTVGTLAAGVAHEINNPLAYVATNLEVLSAELPRLPTCTTPRGDLRAMVADAREGVERVSAIVRELRALARPDREPRGPVDIAAVLASSIKLVDNELRHRARVIQSFAPDLPRVHAHASRLGQVFLNLLLNAAQAIVEGHADENTLTVRASTTADGSHVCVEIEDTGCGIPPAILHRIFDPFFTTKPPGSGMGLGLAITHQIVRELDGQIAVDSRRGRGSTFRVLLPGDHSPPPPPELVPRAPAAPRARILLIDDEAAVGRSLAALLDDSHDVVPVTCAAAGLELLGGGETFDVILCDLMMPEVSGIDMYQRLGEPDRRRVIFMTGGAFTQQAREFLAGLDRAPLEKPFSEHELRKAIERTLAR